MRRFLIMSAVFALSCMQAQEVLYGLTGNFHKSSIPNVHDSSKGRFGGGGGVFAEIGINRADVDNYHWLYIVPQIEYNTGGETAEANSRLLGSQKYSNNYFSGAAFIKYYLHRGRIRRDAYFFGGPRAEFLVSHSKSTTAAYEAAYYKYNLDSRLATTGFGLSIGTGLHLGDHFEGFLRFDRTFTKVYPDNPAQTYNRQLAVGVNYFFMSN